MKKLVVLAIVAAVIFCLVPSPALARGGHHGGSHGGIHNLGGGHHGGGGGHFWGGFAIGSFAGIFAAPMFYPQPVYVPPVYIPVYIPTCFNKVVSPGYITQDSWGNRIFVPATVERECH